MTTPSEESALSPEIRIYMSCMEEVRLRVSLVSTVLARSITTTYEMFDTELIFVQLRKTLEQIVFASLAANKEKYSAAHEDFATHWNARRMLGYLGKVNPDFYPTPLDLVSMDDKGTHRHFHFEPVADGFLTKEDFVTLYEKCGQILHARNPFSTQDRVVQLGFSVQQWVARIQKLLTRHTVHLVDSESSWIVTIPRDGNVHAGVYQPVE